MLAYQSNVLELMCGLYNFSQKDVLEIGGSPPYDVAADLVRRGANSITVINYRCDLKDIDISEKISFRNIDARSMACFPSECFDFIFGIAVLEHLPDFDTVLMELKRVLRSHGQIYLHGAAFWSSHLGHHVYVHINGVLYAFNDNNPIPDWGHLIYDKDEMFDYLTGTALLDLKAASAIIEYVYDNRILNRLHYEDIIGGFKRCGFHIVDAKVANWRSPDEETIALIRAKFGGELYSRLYQNYSCGELSVLLQVA